MTMNVTKRDGRLEELNMDKIEEVVKWASQGLPHVSVSNVVMNAKLQFFDGITTSEIHQSLTKSAADLISEFDPDYQYVAGRLLMTYLRKEAYGQHTPPELYDHLTQMTEVGKYDPELLQKYSKDDIDVLGRYIDHEKDMDYTFAAMSQWKGKYLVQDRTTKRVYESPQVAIMLMSMCFFQDYPKATRKRYVKNFYKAVSDCKLSLPTPIMSGLRTPTRQFSSCVTMEAGDSLESITEVTTALVKYISQKAGIGLNAGRIRALGSSIRGGDAYHTGSIPFYKLFQAAIKSCSQGSVRNGSGTLYYPIWHKDVESLMVLKNNKGSEDNRVRHLDYAVQMNGHFLRKALAGEKYTLFCPYEAKGLYDAFFEDQEEFARLYDKYSSDGVTGVTVNAVELLGMFTQERSGTGRVYAQFVDNCNEAPFDSKLSPIHQSNLCVAPETKVLTDTGYESIADLEGDSVKVWNGEEWSETVVVKTGENQKLLKVSTNAGYTLDCTPYHKFYVAIRDKNLKTTIVEKRAHELKEGDKLIKSDFPVIEGYKELKHAYANGFYSGDGTVRGASQMIYLYHEKRELRDKFGDIFTNWYVDEKQNREIGTTKVLKDKFFVPSNEYNISSRLQWLAGILDSDGTVARNGKTQSLQLGNIEYGFLQEVQLMLQTLGVSSKVTLAAEDGYRKLPKNDGSGENGDYWCQKIYRLLIGQTGICKLKSLGFKTHRLEITDHVPNRECTHFVKITSVVDEGRVDDTYCFTEPKRNMGVFNGILTGQCLESILPTTPLTTNSGEISLCTLAAFNVGIIEESEYEHLADLIVRALDYLLDYQDYPVKAAEISLKRRSLGVGVINYAYALAKRGLKYSDGSANEFTHELMERIQFNLLKASNVLAKERGACEMFNHTLYSQGKLPVDWYNKNVDKLVDNNLKQDWETLRADIKLHGLRNSTMTALMPAETSSQISNSTNGIEPIRALTVTKGSKEGKFKQVAPDVQELYSKYEKVWDIKSNTGYINLCAIMQKFVDQGISLNTNYKPSDYENGLVPFNILVQDIVTAWKTGNKTMYYHNTYDGSGIDDVEEIGCDGGACAI